MQRRRITGIEGLRGIAAGGVLLCHFAQYSPHSTLTTVLGLPLRAGVELFFGLSAFLLFQPFAAAIVNGSSLPHTGRYLVRRARRIAPAYIAWVLLVSLVLGAAAAPPVHDAPFGFQHDAGVIGSDLLLVQNLRSSTFGSGIGPAWSLAIEAAFYLLLPLLAGGAMLLARRLRTRRARIGAALAAPALLALVGVGTKIVLPLAIAGSARHAALPGSYQILDRSLLGCADLFAPGMLLAVAVVARIEGVVVAPRVRSTLIRLLLIVGIPLLLVGSFLLPDPLFEPLIALAACGVIALVVLQDGSGPGALARLLERRAPRLAGEISYSVFLINLPLVVLLDRSGLYGSGAARIPLNLGLTIVACGSLAWLSYRLIERPFMQPRRWSSIGVRAGRIRSAERAKPT